MTAGLTLEEEIFAEYQRTIRHQDPKRKPKEEVQNMQDAKASRMDVIVGFVPSGDGLIIPFDIYTDNGTGMDHAVLTKCYPIQYSSSKEGDFTQTGKYGVGAFTKLGLPWKYTLVTTTPRMGESQEIFGMHKGDKPIYRLVFSDNSRLRLPHVELYMLTPDDLKQTGVFSAGTSVMQVYEPIKAGEFTKFVKEILGNLETEASKVATPLYFAVAEGWKLVDVKGNTAYQMAAGPAPKFVKLNISPDLESSLDEPIVKSIVPGFKGILPEGFKELGKYGWRTRPYFNLGMVMDHIESIPPDKREQVVNALKSIRVSEKLGSTQLSAVLSEGGRTMEVRNHGILLWKGSEEGLSDQVAAYIDSAVIHHDLTRSGIAREGKTGEQYVHILHTLPGISHQLFRQFISGMSSGTLPRCAETESLAIRLIRGALDFTAKSLSVKEPFETIMEYGKRAKKAAEIAKGVAGMLGADSLQYPFLQAHEGRCSLTAMLSTTQSLGYCVVEDKNYTSIAERLEASGLCVIDYSQVSLLSDLHISQSIGTADFLAPTIVKSQDAQESRFLECLAGEAGLAGAYFSTFEDPAHADLRWARVQGNGTEQLYCHIGERFLPITAGKNNEVTRPKQVSLFINYGHKSNQAYLELARRGQGVLAAKFYSHQLRGG